LRWHWKSWREKRPAFLDAVCEGDTALRARLEALLAAHEQPGTLLATQAEPARPAIKLDLADAPDVMGSVNGMGTFFREDGFRRTSKIPVPPSQRSSQDTAWSNGGCDRFSRTS
jgi:hypothetical protein